MDKDKLNKAAEEYAHENAWYPGETFYESDIIAMEESFSDTFKQGASWLMQQPLADRLTDEEKEKIIKRYKNELEVAQHHTLKMKESANPTSRQFHANVREGYVSRLKLLESIFGKNLFNEK